MKHSLHFCYDCAFKHVAAARVYWNEVQNGYFDIDHVAYVVGNLACAEIHIFELHDELAISLREMRKAFWDSFLCEDPYRPDFESVLNALVDAAISVPKEDEEIDSEGSELFTGVGDAEGEDSDGKEN